MRGARRGASDRAQTHAELWRHTSQVRVLKGGVDVISGTPGRVWDLVSSGKLRLGDVQFFVLDEADRLLDTGNEPTIMKIHQKLAKGRGCGRLQTLLFSATLHTPEVRALADRITQRPTFVDLKGKDAVPETVHHIYVHVDAADARAVSGVQPTTDGVHKVSAPPPTFPFPCYPPCTLPLLSSVLVPPRTAQSDRTGAGVRTAEGLSEGTKALKPHVLLEARDAPEMRSRSASRGWRSASREGRDRDLTFCFALGNSA